MLRGIRPYGPGAVLVEVDDAATGVALAAWLRSAEGRAVGVDAVDVVPGAGTVLLDGVGSVEAVRTALAQWRPAHDGGGPDEVIEVPVTYDGADLERVAEHWRVDAAEVVARHTAIEFTSAFCGFVPGFAYLAGLPSGWAVPRLESPRTRVPAGAVALADAWCGVYPGASPGGWLLLGRTDVPVWDVSRPDPCVLSPGTRIRFVTA